MLAQRLTAAAAYLLLTFLLLRSAAAAVVFGVVCPNDFSLLVVLPRLSVPLPRKEARKQGWKEGRAAATALDGEGLRRLRRPPLQQQHNYEELLPAWVRLRPPPRIKVSSMGYLLACPT